MALKTRIEVDGLVIDMDKRLVARNGTAIKLTPREYDLLCTLATNAGRVMTHSQILTAVWGPAHKDDTQYSACSSASCAPRWNATPPPRRFYAPSRGSGTGLGRAGRGRPSKIKSKLFASFLQIFVRFLQAFPNFCLVVLGNFNGLRVEKIWRVGFGVFPNFFVSAGNRNCAQNTLAPVTS